MIKKILIFVTILALLSTMLLPLLSGLAQATDIPAIPQPEFMPGPTTGTDSSTVQDYLLNTGIPKAMNIGIGLLGLAAFMGIFVVTHDIVERAVLFFRCRRMYILYSALFVLKLRIFGMSIHVLVQVSKLGCVYRFH